MNRCLFVVVADVWICSLLQQELYYINMTPTNVILNQKQTFQRNKISLYLWNLSHIHVLYQTRLHGDDKFNGSILLLHMAIRMKGTCIKDWTWTHIFHIQNWFKVRLHNLSNYRQKYTSNLLRDLCWFDLYPSDSIPRLGWKLTIYTDLLRPWPLQTLKF